MSAQFEVLIFRVTLIRYCLIAQNGQVVENWRSASRTETRTIDLAAMEITVDHQDYNHEVQRATDWPVQFSLFIIFAFHFETTGGPHRDASEPWSDDEDDTWADAFLSELQHHINDRTFDHRFVR
ncbi:hypothetical protein AVEN_183077-1 [Araneus ventricosus]|uniref:Uncharacterized protein n=1 Tax=Araneus ventricosus TaxID=182803 RepID=A0A4Y2TRJ5_ARAVE|nr:hypothetical protein AVEN_183077-1 [Araneus ventricosus]